MILPVLVTLIVILGSVVYYIYYLAPKLNPVNRAQSFLDENQVEEAILEFKKILDRNPANFLAHFKLGELYFGEDMVDQGVLHFEEIIKIGKFSHEVEKIDVMRSLGRVYLGREEFDKAFDIFFEISRIYPGDVEALYQVSFIALGQEAFEVAYKYFDRLVKLKNDKSFEILFGAGMSAYQNQKTNEAVDFFKRALAVDSHSEIGNIAMAFALQRKRDFKTAVNYAKMVADNARELPAIMISKRILGILLMQAGRDDEAIKTFEELIEITRQNEMNDELVMALYDLGFICIHAEKTQLAYEFWNQLYQLDKNYRRIVHLVTLLRKEMDTEERKKIDPGLDSVIDHISKWLKETFPENFVWKICGLKNNIQFDLLTIIRARNYDSRQGPVKSTSRETAPEETGQLDTLYNLDVENFRITANRLVEKLGFFVDEILPTYRDSDGVDFMAHSAADKKKTLVWFRRWDDAKVGEIPLRNFAQAINDTKVEKGLFITTSELTSAAEGALSRLSKVEVIHPDQISSLLSGILK